MCFQEIQDIPILETFLEADLGYMLPRPNETRFTIRCDHDLAISRDEFGWLTHSHMIT